AATHVAVNEPLRGASLAGGSRAEHEHQCATTNAEAARDAVPELACKQAGNAGSNVEGSLGLIADTHHRGARDPALHERAGSFTGLVEAGAHVGGEADRLGTLVH